MYSKIAVNNVKKSFKDYTIYFLTLTLAVCIFYSFNSIESQKAILEIKGSSSDTMTSLIQVISYISVFVSVILGSLILYANNFLIKKRKKELGIYMTLGMGKQKISRILITETLIVGILSLIGGLIVGVLMSQGLSAFTLKLFEVGLSEYKFSISASAISKTILYFGIMFILVMVFNTVVISKYKIIDLLVSGRKNESIKIKNPIIYLITFILCVVSLAGAYSLIIKVGLDLTNIKFLLSIFLGIIGTVLFFFSLAGFGLYIIEKNKKVYFKGLNIFVAKQINSKVNTNYISMSVICLMLFITIGVLSTGLSFKNALESGLEETTPFDASGYIYINEGDKITSIEEALNNIGFKFDQSDNYVYYNEYRTDIKPQEILGEKISSENQKELSKWSNLNVELIKLSEYNAIMRLNNKKEVTLKDNEVLLLSNIANMADIANKFLSKTNKINFDGKEFTVKNDKVLEDALNTDYMKSTWFTLVVNDNLTDSYSIKRSYFNVNFNNENKEKSEEKFTKLFTDYLDGKVDTDKGSFILGLTKDQVYEENKGMTTVMLFVGIYIGIVFLVTSMAVLALQQLSEASDSIDRYASLKRIGANEQMINKTIFKQVLIYFMIPIVLAFIHSIVGIKVANDYISMFNKPNIGIESVITALLFIIVYIVYFLATYSGYKNIVKTNI